MLNKSVTVFAGALTVAICLMATAQAQAAPRTGSISFAAPTNPPSFDPQRPATEQAPAVDTFSVAYDDVAGTVTATMRLYEPTFWGIKTPGAGFSLDSECTQRPGESNVTTSHPPLLVGTFGPARPPADEIPGDPPYAQVTRAGYQGAAQGTFTFDGTTSTATVTSPLLAGLDVRCFEFHGTDADPYLQGDWLRSGTHSYGPVTLTRSVAELAFTATLTKRYGTAFTASTRRYVRCSTFVWKDDDDTQNTDCMTEFRTGTTWRYAAAGATVAPGDYQATTRQLSARRWTRHWRRNSGKCARSWHVAGTLYSNDGTCAAALAAHYYKGTTFSGGTGTAAFPKLTQYRCSKHQGVMECANEMGDAMRWKR